MTQDELSSLTYALCMSIVDGCIDHDNGCCYECETEDDRYGDECTDQEVADGKHEAGCKVQRAMRILLDMDAKGMMK